MLVLFFATLVFVAAVVLLYSSYKLGGIKNTIAYFKHRGYILQHWLIAGGAALLAVGILSTLSANSEAEEIEWLKYTEVYFGVDYQPKAPVCASDVDESITANAGLRQHLAGIQIGTSRVDWLASYVHHSCAIGEDTEQVYDGLGLMVSYTIYWH